MDKIRCERCGLEKGANGVAIDVKYYKHAKQTLCDCCIDIFNGDSWGYNDLKRSFGAEQAKRMLTLGFDEVPFGFKINKGLPMFLGEENNLENIIQCANELNSELEADNKVREERIKNMSEEEKKAKEKEIKAQLIEAGKEMMKVIKEIESEEKQNGR